MIMLTLQTILDLLVLSDRYGFSELKGSVEDILCINMNLSNVLPLMAYADVYNATILHKRCAAYVDSNARSVLVSHNMLLVPKEHLKNLLQRDTFVASEIAIFEAVMRWKEYNGMETEDIDDVLKCVRLTEIPTELLAGIVEPSGLYSQDDIKEALKESASPTGQQPRGKLGACIYELMRMRGG